VFISPIFIDLLARAIRRKRFILWFFAHDPTRLFSVDIVITSIKRGSKELIPYEKPDFTFGYDEIRNHLPQEIIDLLDRKLN